MRRAPGSGSRARSRELGYADAMADMWHLLDKHAGAWREAEVTEAEKGFVELAAVFGTIAARQERIARYAFDVHQLLIEGNAAFARNAGHLEAMEREGFHWARAPRELPQREQSENN